MRQQCLMTAKFKRIASSAVCKIIINELSVKASRALKHAADVIADSPAALQVIIFSSDILIIMIFMVIMSSHHHHRQQNHYSLHDHHAISSSATCKRWTASLPRTTARSSSPFPSTSSRNSALPNKPRERCVFLGPRGPLVLPSIGLT